MVPHMGQLLHDFHFNLQRVLVSYGTDAQLHAVICYCIRLCS